MPLKAYYHTPSVAGVKTRLPHEVFIVICPKGGMETYWVLDDFTFTRASFMYSKYDLVIVFSYELLEIRFVLSYGGNKI